MTAADTARRLNDLLRANALALAAWSILLVALAAATWWLPGHLVDRDAGDAELRPAARIEATNARRTAAYQVIGGLALAAGATATLRQVRVNREAHLTESFSCSVEQIASKDITVRVGAINTMQGVMAASRDRRWPIANLLTTYIRERSRTTPAPVADARRELPWMRVRSPDVQAAIDALVRLPHARDYEGSQRRRNFNFCDLRRAHFEHANLSWASLQSTRLDGSYLVGADLRHAICGGASFRDADLRGANLDGATQLDRADLTGAIHDATTRWPPGFEPPARRDAAGTGG